MNLVIFDIDGTLTLTNEVDELCFLKTAQVLISPEIKEIVAESFTHYTDENIVRELFLWNTGKEPSALDYLKFSELLQTQLLEMRSQQPHSFLAVEGADRVLKSLDSNWAIALATGCWAFSANLKLAAAAIALPEALPISTSDKVLSRQEIMLNAIELAKQRNEVAHFDHIVYVGDGIWDLRTCASLGIPFVGIEAQGKLSKQIALGDFYKLNNYNDLEYFETCLQAAIIPI